MNGFSSLYVFTFKFVKAHESGCYLGILIRLRLLTAMWCGVTDCGTCGMLSFRLCINL
jgi:hypothetical protein